MTYQRIAIARRIAVLMVVAVIVVAAISVTAFVLRESTTCVYSAEPIALALSVVSDTNQTPAVGAHVTATSTPFLCNGAPATPAQTLTFVTNNSEWHYLTSGDDSGYTFMVNYSGHNYSISTTLYIEAATCVTLFVPSGRTNVTFGSFQSTCPPAVTSTTASTSATGTSQLYQLEFLQESNCANGPWLVPWAVVLDGETLTQPSNAMVSSSVTSLSGTGPGPHHTYDSNLSTIWFSVPNGIYSYTILPNYALGSEQSGNVTVDGSNVQVQVYAFVEAMGCSSTSTSVGG